LVGPLIGNYEFLAHDLVEKEMAQVGNIKECMTQAYKKLDAFDTDGFLAYMADDITYHLGKLSYGKGKPNIEIALKQLHAGVIAMQHYFLSAYQTGNTLLVEVKVIYTKKNNREVTLTGIISLKIEKGLIQVIKIFMDFAPLSE
jgi:hypothetical protein